MFELIILGTIPGTNFQITFYDILIGLVLIGLITEMILVIRHHNHAKNQTNNDLNLISP